MLKNVNIVSFKFYNTQGLLKRSDVSIIFNSENTIFQLMDQLYNFVMKSVLGFSFVYNVAPAILLISEKIIHKLIHKYTVSIQNRQITVSSR